MIDKIASRSRQCRVASFIAAATILFNPTLQPKAAADQFTELYTIPSTPDVFLPVPGITQGNDGNFYIASPAGGPNYLGEIDEITPSGTVTVLHTFTSSEGNTPQQFMALGPDGNFYGICSKGGTHSNGTIFKMTPAGTVTTLHNLGVSEGTPQILNQSINGLTYGLDGNFYGTLQAGGSAGYGTLFSVTQSGVVTVLHNFTHDDGATPQNARLALGTDGSLYGVTTVGGHDPYGAGTIFQYRPSDNVFRTLFFFRDDYQSNIEAGLTFGQDGKLYGTDANLDSNYGGTIYSIKTDWTYSHLGNLPIEHSYGVFPTGALALANNGTLYGTTQVTFGRGPGGLHPNPGNIFYLGANGSPNYQIGFPEQLGYVSGLVAGTDGSLYGVSADNYTSSIFMYPDPTASAKSVVFKYDLGIPASPTELHALEGNNAISLSWHTFPGAVSYNVYRGLAAGAEDATPIATGVTTPSFTDTSVVGQTRYYYQVTAVNADTSETARSYEVYSSTKDHLPLTQYIFQPVYVTTPYSGQTFAMSVTAENSYGEILRDYAGTVHFTSSDPFATLPSDTALVNGVGTVTVMFRKSGAQTITVSDAAGTGITGQYPFNVTGVKYVIPDMPATAAVGARVIFHVHAEDANGNPLAYSDTAHFSSSDNKAILPADAQIGMGGTFTVTFKTTGSRAVRVTDNAFQGITGLSSTVNVTGTATKLIISTLAAAAAGGKIMVNVSAQDGYGNIITTATPTVHFTSNDPKAVLPADLTLTAGKGQAVVTLNTVGTKSIVATDTAGSLVVAKANVVVTVGAVTKLAVTATASGKVNSHFIVKVTAQDAAGNAVTGYTGPVHFTDSATPCILPADSALTNGTGSFTLVLQKAVQQKVSVSDAAHPGIQGLSNIITVTP